VDIFYQSIIKDVNAYLLEFRELLFLENFSGENSYNKTKKNESEEIPFTDSLTVLSNYLKTNFEFENLEIENEKFYDTKIIEKILELIIKNYYLIIKSIDSSIEGIINKKILSDFALLRKIYNEIKSDISEDDEIIKIFNEIINIYKIWDLDEYHDIYFFFIKNNRLYKNKNNRIIYNNLQHDLKNYLHSVTKKEFLAFHSRINVFMLSKNEIKSQKSKQSNFLNCNSTSKLLELRIDENYLSKRLTPSISNKSNEINYQNLKHEGETQSLNYQQYLKSSVSNKESPSSLVTSNTHTQQPNIKEYLGFFGGMLKENIKNMAKNYIDNEKQGEKK
jgi:hypothetical protein